MRARLWVGVGIAVGCFAAGVALVAPGLPRRLGLDFWAVGGLRREIEATRRAIERTDADLAEVRERAWIKEAILGELAAGRMTLREAAERCRDLTPPTAWSAQLAALHFYYPDLTDEECVRRNLIDRVRAGSAGDGLARAERLEREWTAEADRRTSPGLQ